MPVRRGKEERENTMQSRQHGFELLGRWIRELHLCAGLFVSPFVVVFAASAILLNHTCKPWEAPSEETRESKTGIELPEGKKDLEFARAIIDFYFSSN